MPTIEFAIPRKTMNHFPSVLAVEFYHLEHDCGTVRGLAKFQDLIKVIDRIPKDIPFVRLPCFVGSFASIETFGFITGFYALNGANFEILPVPSGHQRLPISSRRQCIIIQANFHELVEIHNKLLTGHIPKGATRISQSALKNVA